MIRSRGVLLLAGLLAAALTDTAANAACQLKAIAEIPLVMRDGRPLASARINGADVRFVVDSGAFFSMITPATASEQHLRLEPAPAGLTVLGAGGAVGVQLARVEKFGVAGATLHGVQFLVGGSETGQDTAGLLGQNFLGLKDAEFDLANGVVRLIEENGCGSRALTYWSSTLAYGVEDILPSDLPRHTAQTQAFVNNTRIVVAFDTGASQSYLAPSAARRAGIDLHGPQVADGGPVSGLGRHLTPSSIVPVDSFKVGGEEIRHTHLRVAEIGLPGVDMLLGADFFLSHHIYVANARNRV